MYYTETAIWDSKFWFSAFVLDHLCSIVCVLVFFPSQSPNAWQRRNISKAPCGSQFRGIQSTTVAWSAVLTRKHAKPAFCFHLSFSLEPSSMKQYCAHSGWSCAPQFFLGALTLSMDCCRPGTNCTGKKMNTIHLAYIIYNASKIYVFMDD